MKTMIKNNKYNSLAEAEFLDALQKLCKRFMVTIDDFGKRGDDPGIYFLGEGINLEIDEDLLTRK